MVSGHTLKLPFVHSLLFTPYFHNSSKILFVAFPGQYPVLGGQGGFIICVCMLYLEHLKAQPTVVLEKVTTHSQTYSPNC